MDTTTENRDQADEDLLNCTVSDEAIEAAAADAHLQAATQPLPFPWYSFRCCS